MLYIVYEFIFNERKDRGEFPYSYIGCKGKCSIVDNKIIDKFGKIYYGSSSSKLYNDLIYSNEPIMLNVLYVGKNHKDVIDFESNLIRKLRCDTSIYHFNMMIPPKNNWCLDNYATYRHKDYDIYCRLPRDHDFVRCGIYVGTNKGKSVNSGRVRLGSYNSFYGRTHSDETKQKLRDVNLGKKHTQETKDKMSINRKGKIKSNEHRMNISKSNKGKAHLVTYNVNTGTKVILTSHEYNLYYKHREEWLLSNQIGSLFSPKRKKCPFCGKEGNIGNMNRWHFNNCKLKVKI